MYFHFVKYRIFLLSLILIAQLFSAEVMSLENPNEKLEKLRRNMESEKEKLQVYKKKELNILNDIEKVNQTLMAKTLEIGYYQEKIKKTNKELQLTQEEIRALKETIITRKGVLNERLTDLYKHNLKNKVSILVSSEDYQDLLMRFKFLKLLLKYDQKVIERYIEKKKTLHMKEIHLKEQKQQLQSFEKKVINKQKELLAEQKQKNTLLGLIQKKKTIQESMLKEMEKSAKELFEQLKSRKKESETNETFDFALLKGKLPWPIKGSLLSSFGSQKSSTYNIPILRNGILIKADVGDTVKSIAKGTVVFADWFKGYGKMIIINHGNGYHSLYAHLTDIFLNESDKIESLEDVGKVGVSGVLNKPGLYFELRYKGKPVNPLLWLESTKR